MASIEEHQADLACRRHLAAAAVAFAGAPRAEAIDTQIVRHEQYRRYSTPRCVTEFGTGQATAGFDTDDAHFTVSAWVSGAQDPQEALCGTIEIKAADGSFAGAIAALDHVIAAALELRGALAERADVAPGRQVTL